MLGDLFTLGSFFENYKSKKLQKQPNYLGFFSNGQSYVLISTKKVGAHFGRQFSQTHPVTLDPMRDCVKHS
jgi:hypothetical protein